MTQVRDVFSAWSFCSLVLIAFASTASAEILFEGYSKVYSGEVHVGYAIARYAFNPKTNEFEATTFLRTGDWGGNITESLKTFSDPTFKPLRYNFTSLTGKDGKTIDGKIEALPASRRSTKKNSSPSKNPSSKTSSGKSGGATEEKWVLNATIRELGKVRKVNRRFKDGVFFSSVLAYVVLRSPSGLKVDTSFDYEAIAEETASIDSGKLSIRQRENYMGMQPFRVLNEFKGVRFTSLVSEKGEMLLARALSNPISTELVATPGEATEGFPVASSMLISLFGEVPKGRIHPIAVEQKPDAALPSSRRGSQPAGPPIAPPPGKGFIDPNQPSVPLRTLPPGTTPDSEKGKSK